MSCLVGQHLNFLSLKLTKSVLNFFFCIFVSITNIIIAIKYFVVEEFWKLNSSLVKDSLVLIDAYDMWNTCLEEYLTYLLRVATCYIHELERCLCREIWCFRHLSKCLPWYCRPSWCFNAKAWCNFIHLLSFKLLQLILNIRYHVL